MATDWQYVEKLEQLTECRAQLAISRERQRHALELAAAAHRYTEALELMLIVRGVPEHILDLLKGVYVRSAV